MSKQLQLWLRLLQGLSNVNSIQDGTPIKNYKHQNLYNTLFADMCHCCSDCVIMIPWPEKFMSSKHGDLKAVEGVSIDQFK